MQCPQCLHANSETAKFELVRAYQAACAEVIDRNEGHIAPYLGDGLLVYFGYPQAHADDAQWAVRTGLGMVAAIGQLSAQLQQDTSIQLAVRVGIHTGLVIVGEIGGDGWQERRWCRSWARIRVGIVLRAINLLSDISLPSQAFPWRAGWERYRDLWSPSPWRGRLGWGEGSGGAWGAWHT